MVEYYKHFYEYIAGLILEFILKMINYVQPQPKFFNRTYKEKFCSCWACPWQVKYLKKKKIHLCAVHCLNVDVAILRN